MNNQFLILKGYSTKIQNTVIQVGLLKKTVISNEEELHLEITEIDKKIAEPMIEESVNYLEINGNSIGLLAMEIPLLAFDSLWQKAGEIDPYPDSCTSYITGFKMFYAVREGVFTLYFRPVKFCLLSKCYGQGAQLFGRYKLHEVSSTYYKYVQPAFVEVTDSNEKNTILTEFANYRNLVKIRHRDGDTDRTPFIAESDITGDVCATIFSFQEVFALAEASSSSVNIRFWNSIEDVTYNNDRWNKHGLLLSTEVVTYAGPVISVHTYCGSFANLSHMCPPSCTGDLLFRLKA